MKKIYLQKTFFGILFIVVTALANPSFIGDFHPNTKVVLLPPNTTSL
jgi:hypothetical protein